MKILKLFCFLLIISYMPYISLGQGTGNDLFSVGDSNTPEFYDSVSFLIPDIVYQNEFPEEHIFTTVSCTRGNYLCILDPRGNPVFYRKMRSQVNNFMPQKTGQLTYFDPSILGFIAMDQFFNAADTFFMQNGYVADMHEFILQDNGERWMLSYDRQMIDMSEIVEGGQVSATVTGLVIQNINQNDSVLFEWNGWDNFEITDSYTDLQVSSIDYIHANSIDEDSDTSIIISSRNLSEITRINTKTGEIIWRLGGKNNEFTFIKDDRGFAGQHSAIKLDNGNLLLFDNGLELEPLYSRGVEYRLIENERKVSLVNEYLHDPIKYSYVMGNIQRLENGHTFIYWGSIKASKTGTFSEYNTRGEVNYEVAFQAGTVPGYKMYLSKWRSKIFTLDRDTVYFIKQNSTGRVVEEVEIGNNTDRDIPINKVYHKENSFSLLDTLPITIVAGGKRIFKVAFQSDGTGEFEDIINFCHETDSSLVAAQVHVIGTSSLSIGNHPGETEEPDLFPNPLGDYLYVNSSRNIERILVFDVNGRQVLQSMGSGNEMTISTQVLEKGLYTVVVYTKNHAIHRRLMVKL